MKAFEKVYAITAFIPKGKVATYQQISTIAKVNPRVVGFALHENENIKIVPCHRVVSKSGHLTGYARGGIKRKKEILEEEGVLFLDNGCVNLSKSLYKPSKALLLYFDLLFKFNPPGEPLILIKALMRLL